MTLMVLHYDVCLFHYLAVVVSEEDTGRRPLPPAWSLCLLLCGWAERAGRGLARAGGACQWLLDGTVTVAAVSVGRCVWPRRSGGGPTLVNHHRLIVVLQDVGCHLLHIAGGRDFKENSNLLHLLLWLRGGLASWPPGTHRQTDGVRAWGSASGVSGPVTSEWPPAHRHHHLRQDSLSLLLQHDEGVRLVLLCIFSFDSLRIHKERFLDSWWCVRLSSTDGWRPVEAIQGAWQGRADPHNSVRPGGRVGEGQKASKAHGFQQGPWGICHFFHCSGIRINVVESVPVSDTVTILRLIISYSKEF